MTQMSQREKVLASLVGGVFFLLINVIAIKFLMQNKQGLDVQRAKVETKIRGFKQDENERELWSTRDKWLNEAQPILGDSDVANREFIKVLKDIAAKHEVIFESPQPGVPVPAAHHTALGVRLEAKGPWTGMAKFLKELQDPGQFIALESLELKVDSADKTKVRATVNIAKWFRKT